MLERIPQQKQEQPSLKTLFENLLGTLNKIPNREENGRNNLWFILNRLGNERTIDKLEEILKALKSLGEVQKARELEVFIRKYRNAIYALKIAKPETKDAFETHKEIAKPENVRIFIQELLKGLI